MLIKFAKRSARCGARLGLVRREFPHSVNLEICAITISELASLLWANNPSQRDFDANPFTNALGSLGPNKIAERTTQTRHQSASAWQHYGTFVSLSYTKRSNLGEITLFAVSVSPSSS